MPHRRRPPALTNQVHGTSAGGGADELRLLSTSDTYINLSAQGGSLDFVSTRVSFSPLKREDSRKSTTVVGGTPAVRGVCKHLERSRSGIL